MRYLGPTATDPDEFITLGQAQDLLGTGGGSGGSSSSSSAGRGINYGETKAIGKLLAVLGLVNVNPVPMVYAGDSITRGYNSGSTISTNPYVNRLSARLKAAFPLDAGSHPADTLTPSTYASMTAGINTINVGISSTHSGNYFQSSLRTSVAAANPRVVFHNIGTNDFRNFGIDIPTFKSNIQTVIDDLKAQIAGPCVHILLHHYATLTAVAGKPIAPWSDYGAAKQQIAEADPDNVAFIDMSSAFADIGIYYGGPDPLGLISDGTHPTDKGHLCLADLIYMAVFGGP